MRIAAYCRVSTGKEEQLDSLCNQKRFFEEYAEKNGCELVGLYADEGISGTGMKKRAAFIRLMGDARRGLFDTVVVKDISRFARNTVDFLQSIRELNGLGINTRFITANMESLGESEFVLTIFGAMAQEESANLSKRVKFGKRISAQKGSVPQRIFGYDRVDNFTLAVNLEESRTVQEIFRLYLEDGMGCRTISRVLNQEGRRTKYGCDWNAGGVRRVLTNPIYCGHYVNHRTEVEDYLTGRQVPIPVQEQYHHLRPEWAVISEDTYKRAREELARRGNRSDGGKPSRHSRTYLLSTLIRCSCCGRAFCRKQYTYAATRVYWKCGGNDSGVCGNTTKLEEWEMLEQIRGYLCTAAGDREELIRSVWTDSGRTDEESRQRGRKKRELLSRRSRCREMYIGGVLTMEELKHENKLIEEELARLECTPETARENVCRETVRAFLELEDVTGAELHQLLEGITVDERGTVRFHVRKLGETDDL